MKTHKIDKVGDELANAALTMLVRLYPEIRNASTEEREAACAAMRAKAKLVLDKLFEDVQKAPWIAHIAFKTAALTLAHEGIQALENSKKQTNLSYTP